MGILRPLPEPLQGGLRGPHVGTYDLTGGQCDALVGQIISMFTPKQAGVAAGPKTPESMELYTEPSKGGNPTALR